MRSWDGLLVFRAHTSYGLNFGGPIHRGCTLYLSAAGKGIQIFSSSSIGNFDLYVIISKPVVGRRVDLYLSSSFRNVVIMVMI